MGEDGASEGEEQEDIADFGGEEPAEWVQEDRGSAKWGEGEWRDVHPLSLFPRLRGSRHTSAEAGASVLKAQKPGQPQAVASGHSSASSGSTVGSS